MDTLRRGMTTDRRRTGKKSNRQTHDFFLPPWRSPFAGAVSRVEGRGGTTNRLLRLMGVPADGAKDKRRLMRLVRATDHTWVGNSSAPRHGHGAGDVAEPTTSRCINPLSPTLLSTQNLCTNAQALENVHKKIYKSLFTIKTKLIQVELNN